MMKYLRFGSGLLLLLCADSFARDFRVDRIPNGLKFECLTCHQNFGGDVRNAIGAAISIRIQLKKKFRIRCQEDGALCVHRHGDVDVRHRNLKAPRIQN